MRLWTLHPRYLDPQGLVALWREGLLARSVLRGSTRGYRHHPQLTRFRSHVAPRSAISSYLAVVCGEAKTRGYSFDSGKAGRSRSPIRILTTTGQLGYEWQHLLRKLRARSPDAYARWSRLQLPEPHPMFEVVPGPIEQWERVQAPVRGGGPRAE